MCVAFTGKNGTFTGKKEMATGRGEVTGNLF